MITDFKLFENGFDNNNKIAELIRSNGYIIALHDRIYLSTIIDKPELISTTYTDFTNKYGDQLLLGAYSFEKIDMKEVGNYPLSAFYYPVEMLEKLFYSNRRINYIELDFFDELKELQMDYHRIILKNKYKI